MVAPAARAGVALPHAVGVGVGEGDRVRGGVYALDGYLGLRPVEAPEAVEEDVLGVRPARRAVARIAERAAAGLLHLELLPGVGDAAGACAGAGVGLTA